MCSSAVNGLHLNKPSDDPDTTHSESSRRTLSSASKVFVFLLLIAKTFEFYIYVFEINF